MAFQSAVVGLLLPIRDAEAKARASNGATTAMAQASATSATSTPGGHSNDDSAWHSAASRRGTRRHNKHLFTLLRTRIFCIQCHHSQSFYCVLYSPLTVCIVTPRWRVAGKVVAAVKWEGSTRLQVDDNTDETTPQLLQRRPPRRHQSVAHGLRSLALVFNTPPWGPCMIAPRPSIIPCEYRH